LAVDVACAATLAEQECTPLLVLLSLAFAVAEHFPLWLVIANGLPGAFPRPRSALSFALRVISFADSACQAGRLSLAVVIARGGLGSSHRTVTLAAVWILGVGLCIVVLGLALLGELCRLLPNLFPGGKTFALRRNALAFHLQLLGPVIVSGSACRGLILSTGGAVDELVCCGLYVGCKIATATVLDLPLCVLFTAAAVSESGAVSRTAGLAAICTMLNLCTVVKAIVFDSRVFAFGSEYAERSAYLTQKSLCVDRWCRMTTQIRRAKHKQRTASQSNAGHDAV